MQVKQRIHFAPQDIITPSHPISIAVVGVGGTGSRILSELARLHYILLKLGHVGLDVLAIDKAKVSMANIGRQLYYDSDVGKYKSQIMIDRINMNYGMNWKFHCGSFERKLKRNFVISCVDEVEPRIKMIAEINDNNAQDKQDEKYKLIETNKKNYYFIDCGNSYNQGQVICGTTQVIKQPKMSFKTVPSLKTFDKLFSINKLTEAKSEESQQASCSTFEAIGKQDPFINIQIAELAAMWVWQIIKFHKVSEAGYFVSLNPTVIKAIPV